MAFITYEDIKRRRDVKPTLEITVTLRMDRVLMTPAGPVAVLRKGESLIELSYKKSGESDERVTLDDLFAWGDGWKPLARKASTN